MPSSPPYRLAYVVTHPIQYQAPLLKLIANDPEIDLTVVYLSDHSVRAHQDEGFGVEVKWDTPLLDGYHHSFVRSRMSNKGVSFNNPKVSIADLWRTLNKSKWDAVWVHGYANLGLMSTILYTRLRGIPLLFRGENNLLCSPSSWKKNLFISWLVKTAHGLLSIGSANTEFYLHHGARTDQIFAVPYAVNNEFFQARSKVQAPPNDLPQSGKLIFLFASRLLARKHPLTLLYAFAALPDSLREQAALVFIGNGEQAESLQAEIARLQMQDCVSFLGFKDQGSLASYLGSCDVFVLPSEKEPFGLIVNEAMNAAKPIITTNEVGAARDLVQHGKNGWIVEAGNQGELSNALKEAIEQRASLKTMGAQSLSNISAWDFQADLRGIKQALNALDHH